MSTSWRDAILPAQHRAELRAGNEKDSSLNRDLIGLDEPNSRRNPRIKEEAMENRTVPGRRWCSGLRA